jgi:hypothetical protein
MKFAKLTILQQVTTAKALCLTLELRGQAVDSAGKAKP